MPTKCQNNRHWSQNKILFKYILIWYNFNISGGFVTGFQFSTIDHENAKRFLAHESFNHLDQDQRSFILNNLGKVRVLDPNMHGGGKLSFENSEVALEYCKIGTHNSESFMFNCSYMSPNLELIKFGLAKGYPYYQHSLGRVITLNKQDILDFYVEQGLVSSKDVLFALEHEKCSLSFFKTNFIRHAKKLDPGYGVIERFSADELFELVEAKILPLSKIKYPNREKYNKIIKLKKIKKAYLKK